MKHARSLGIVAAAVVALMVPAATPGASGDNPPDSSSGHQFRVLVFTKTAGEKLASTNAGVADIKKLGAQYRFTVQVTDDATKFNESHLKQYRTVVFLNNEGDVLNDAQQAAFEAYFHDGGGFVGIHAAIAAEPDWQFFTDLLGARATGETDTQAGTVKVADRVHDATKDLPEYWERTDRWYSFDTNVRGLSHVLATVVEAPFAKQPSGLTLNAITGAPWAPTIRSRGARTTRAAGRSTRPSGTPPRASTRASARTSRARSSGPRASPTPTTGTAARPCSPTTSRSRSAARRT